MVFVNLEVRIPGVLVVSQRVRFIVTIKSCLTCIGVFLLKKYIRTYWDVLIAKLFWAKKLETNFFFEITREMLRGMVSKLA